jgi:hypothetical protein
MKTNPNFFLVLYIILSVVSFNTLIMDSNDWRLNLAGWVIFLVSFTLFIRSIYKNPSF